MKHAKGSIVKLLLAAGIGLMLSACVAEPAPTYYATPGYYYGPGPAVQFDFGGRCCYGHYYGHHW